MLGSEFLKGLNKAHTAPGLTELKSSREVGGKEKKRQQVSLNTLREPVLRMDCRWDGRERTQGMTSKRRPEEEQEPVT